MLFFTNGLSGFPGQGNLPEIARDSAGYRQKCCRTRYNEVIREDFLMEASFKSTLQISDALTREAGEGT